MSVWDRAIDDFCDCDICNSVNDRRSRAREDTTLSKGLCVIGRNSRMGLGTMTEEFCYHMRPQKLILVNCHTHPGLITFRWMPKDTITVNRESLCLGHVLDYDIVGFETFYNPDLLATPHRKVIVPMWEWSSLTMVERCNSILCLSEADRDQYRHLPGCRRLNWPVEEQRPSDSINRFTVLRPFSWPPRVFVHPAGNAFHNRDGTREVIEASRHLIGTGASLIVYSGFGAESRFNVPRGAPIEFRPSVTDRRQLLSADCMVFPRRLPGHSLPISEAAGAGLPTIVLDLPEWRDWPYRAPAHKQSRERLGPGLRDVWAADPDELGQIMRAMVLGQVPKLPCPHQPSWEEFRQMWQKEIIPCSPTNC